MLLVPHQVTTVQQRARQATAARRDDEIVVRIARGVQHAHVLTFRRRSNQVMLTIGMIHRHFGQVDDAAIVGASLAAVVVDIPIDDVRPLVMMVEGSDRRRRRLVHQPLDTVLPVQVREARRFVRVVMVMMTVMKVSHIDGRLVPGRWRQVSLLLLLLLLHAAPHGAKADDDDHVEHQQRRAGRYDDDQHVSVRPRQVIGIAGQVGKRLVVRHRRAVGRRRRRRAQRVAVDLAHDGRVVEELRRDGYVRREGGTVQRQLAHLRRAVVTGLAVVLVVDDLDRMSRRTVTPRTVWYRRVRTHYA